MHTKHYVSIKNKQMACAGNYCHKMTRYAYCTFLKPASQLRKLYLHIKDACHTLYKKTLQYVGELLLLCLED